LNQTLAWANERFSANEAWTSDGVLGFTAFQEAISSWDLTNCPIATQIPEDLATVLGTLDARDYYGW
jgi:hypothetical protein